MQFHNIGKKRYLAVVKWDRVWSGEFGSLRGWRQLRVEGWRASPPSWPLWQTHRTSPAEWYCWAPSEWSSCSQTHKIQICEYVKRHKKHCTWVKNCEKTTWHLPQVEQQHTHKGERTLDLHWAGYYSDQLEIETQINHQISDWCISIINIRTRTISRAMDISRSSDWPAELKEGGWSPFFWILSHCSLCKPGDTLKTFAHNESSRTNMLLLLLQPIHYIKKYDKLGNISDYKVKICSDITVKKMWQKMFFITLP